MTILETASPPAANSMEVVFVWTRQPVPPFDIIFHPGEPAANFNPLAPFHCLHCSPHSFFDLTIRWPTFHSTLRLGPVESASLIDTAPAIQSIFLSALPSEVLDALYLLYRSVPHFIRQKFPR
jgi:hypothetical protein